MIIGSCPHCDAGVMTPLANVPLPVFSKEICENCKKEYWLKHSRYDAKAYTEKPKECGELIKKGLGNGGN